MSIGTASLDDVRRFFGLLARPGDVFELRGLVRVNGQQHVSTGFFDDLDQLARAAVDRSGKDDGVYVTINPVNPALLARAPKNRVRRAGSGDTTSDRDVQTRRSILVDVDPVRPTGISSTDEEHAAALAMTWEIATDLSALGWPDPILADSGNGGHLIYAVDLPVDDGGLVRRVLERLSKTYSTPMLKVDEKVFNPARISKIYGTLTRKGEDTPDRPHRIARIVEAPAQLAEIPRELLEAFAPETKPMRDLKRKIDTHTVERSTFNADDFIARYLPDAKERPWASGRKWILPVCPFNDSHDRGEAHVEQLSSGAMSAGCLHESCKWKWEDLRKLHEPDAYGWKERQANGNGNGYRRDDEPPPWMPPGEVLFEDAAYQAELDAFAARDNEEQKPVTADRPLWRKLPTLGADIRAHKNDQWVSFSLGGDEIARVRVGSTVVLIGGSGSGKSSLASCLLIEHAKHVGPAIAMSIELPADELAARIVGIRCDASWEDSLRGKVPDVDMDRALDLPRFYVLDRRRATIKNLEKCVEAARAEYPGQPILVAFDYAQLLDSRERDARMRVADAFGQIDDCAREHKFVALALSQMSRANAQKARSGEMLGAESAAAGAESAAIERFATVTFTIGLAAEREDGSSSVELSIGKMRMSKGDRVVPASYYGKSGLWRIAGEAKTAGEVRDQREAEKESKARSTAELAMLGAARIAVDPLVTRAQLMEGISGRKATKVAALSALLARGDLIEVNKKQPRTKYWFLATPDRARDAGVLPRQPDLNLNTGTGAE